MRSKKEPSLDLLLIRRCQAGDKAAFAAVFEHTKNLVFHTAYLTLGNYQDAEDILQEVFIQLYHSIGNYDPARAAFTTWLYRITVNRCLNMRRRHSFIVLDQSVLPETPLQESILSESQHAEVESVQKALMHLSMKLRVVIVLRYFWDLSNAEIAEILRVPLGTVKSRINLALRSLCRDLKDDFSSSILSIPEVQNELPRSKPPARSVPQSGNLPFRIQPDPGPSVRLPSLPAEAVCPGRDTQPHHPFTEASGCRDNPLSASLGSNPDENGE